MKRSAVFGTILLGTAAYLFRNKEARNNTLSKAQSLAKPETREKVMNQIRDFANSKLNGSSEKKDDTVSKADPSGHTLAKSDSSNNTLSKQDSTGHTVSQTDSTDQLS